MSRYNTILKNDVVNGHGVCVSFWVQGCPHQCPGCFNPETWDFEEGQPYEEHTKWEIIEAIGANGVDRNFSVLGGEPLAPQNLEMVEEVVNAVRHAYPKIEIALWTGYEFEDLHTGLIEKILEKVDYLVVGPYIEEEQDLGLKWRGSKNQRVFQKTELDQWIQVDFF